MTPPEILKEATRRLEEIHQHISRIDEKGCLIKGDRGRFRRNPSLVIPPGLSISLDKFCRINELGFIIPSFGESCSSRFDSFPPQFGQTSAQERSDLEGSSFSKGFTA
jgi:hypothetical protein